MNRYYEKLNNIKEKQILYIDEKAKEINDYNYSQIMSDIYKKSKVQLNKYFYGPNFEINESFIRTIRKSIINIEDSFYGKNLYNIDASVPFLIKNKVDMLLKAMASGKSIYELTKRDYLDDKTDDEIIKYIVEEVRQNVLAENFRFYGSNLNLETINFSNCCYPAAEYTNLICAKHGIRNHRITIYPGFGEYGDLENDLMQHHATFVYINGKYYIVDITYSQFFRIYKDNLDRLGVPGLAGTMPGSYMVLDNERLSVAYKLIKDGYIELTDGVFKAYMDGFSLSFRNGLFYEKNNITSYETHYTDYDYLNFLYSDDSQIKHEGKENLGYQKKPLKNPNLDFSSFVK